MPASKAPFRVLFVCLGNICRSPAAEIIFRKHVSDAGCPDAFHIDSAGTIGHHRGSPPDSRMAEALRRNGFPISGQSRQITPSDLESFDLILTMDESNLEDVRSLDPAGLFHSKIRPFVGFCRSMQAPRVPDPYYGGPAGFEHVIQLLNDGCQGLLEKIRDQNPHP
jgi:protein-tyrosine phosphatase